MRNESRTRNPITHHASLLTSLLFLPFAFFLSFPPPLAASELIRVALVDDATQIQISSQHPLLVRFETGERQPLPGPLSIIPEANGLKINGKQVQSRKITIKSAGQEFLLSAKRQSKPKEQATSWDIETTVEAQILNGRLLIVTLVDLEKYVAGVVAAEMNPDWHGEALKTQAVIARTYALYKKRINQDEPYDVLANTQDQVYQGCSSVNSHVRQAVEDTKDFILTHQDMPIFAAYSSTAAGPTEDAINVWSKDLPYLKGVECPFDQKSPRYAWRKTFSLEMLEHQLQQDGVQVGSIATLTPYTYSRAGRIKEMRILHSKGELIIRGQDFRRIVGYSRIPSTQFKIERIGKEVVLSGKGSGHAVGLCQWGTKEMAELGYPYQDILHYYYPGTHLIKRHAVITPTSSSSR